MFLQTTMAQVVYTCLISPPSKNVLIVPCVQPRIVFAMLDFSAPMVKQQQYKINCPRNRVQVNIIHCIQSSMAVGVAIS